MDKAVEPAGEARDDYAIFAAIARRLGVEGRSPRVAADEWQRRSGTSRAAAAEIDVDMPDYEFPQGWPL